MFQVIDCLVDLLELVTIGDQLMQLQFSFAQPAQENWKIAVRLAIAAAGAREGTIADKQTRIQKRFRVRWRDAD